MPKPTKAALEAALRDELEYLWSDLDTAQRYALNGRWSIQCEWVQDRIKTLTQLVGATPWEKIQLRLLENGLYQRTHEELGIEVSPDMDAVREMRARISG